MNTTLSFPPAQETFTASPVKKSTALRACSYGLLGLLPGPGLVLSPLALRLGARSRSSGSAWAGLAVVLGVLGLLVQTTALVVLGVWAFGGMPELIAMAGAPAPEGPPAETKKVKVGDNVVLEVQGDKRRVVVEAVVCMREGQLEQLLTRKMTKEHEAVLAADVDSRHIHAALNLAGAKEGSPVKFAPKYAPASGSTIKITLQYEDKGKLVRLPAQQWVRNVKTRRDLDIDWVFAGSRLVDVPFEQNKKHYLANDGDVICLSNFETAMLDLPIKSPKDNADLVFEANTDRIPPKDTKVTVILEVVPEKK